VTIAEAPRANTPAYAAGLDIGDEIRKIDGAPVAVPGDVEMVLRRHKPGDSIGVEYTDRTGHTKSTQLVLQDDPAVALARVESTGGRLTAAQAAFRTAWLGRRE
jgi:predicted metalloprotease with PDZ domain